MSLATKLVAALILLLALLCAGLALYANHLRGKVSDLQEEVRSAAADASAHGTYASEARVLDREYRNTTQEPRRVLEEQKEWADDPVPSPVADRLRKRTDTP